MYRLAQVYSQLQNLELAERTKLDAARIRQRLIGIPASEADFMGSYDQLVGFMER